MKLLEKVGLLLVSLMLVFGVSLSLVEAASVSLSGSIGVSYQSLLFGGKAVEGKTSIWNKKILKQNITLTHVHPTVNITLSDKVGGDIMFCFSDYHTPQVWIAEIDYAPFPSKEEFGDNLFTIRAGRFIVPFGYFNEAGVHPVNLKSISRPLMYLDHPQEDPLVKSGPEPIIMTPFFDSGVLFFGNTWVRDEQDSLWYGVYAVSGMYYHIRKYEKDTPDFLDVDWESYHIERYKEVSGLLGGDLNDNKAIGARFIYSLGENVSLGVSYQMGKYDPKSELGYALSGLDLGVSLAKVNLRFEYATSPIDWIDKSGAEAKREEIYTKGTRKSYTKQGWYTQLDVPFTLFLGETEAAKKLEFVTMYSELQSDRESKYNKHTFNKIGRFSAGVNFAPDPAIKWQLEYEQGILGAYNATTANVTTYGNKIDNLSRINLSVGLAF